jgi:hypothetical protein
VDNLGVVRIFLRNGHLCYGRHRHSHLIRMATGAHELEVVRQIGCGAASSS